MQQFDTVLDNLSIDIFYDENIAISKTAPSNQTSVNQFESQLQRLRSDTMVPAGGTSNLFRHAGLQRVRFL